MATHSSILAWKIPGTEEPVGLLSMGSQSQTQLMRLSSSSNTFYMDKLYTQIYVIYTMYVYRYAVNWVVTWFALKVLHLMYKSWKKKISKQKHLILLRELLNNSPFFLCSTAMKLLHFISEKTQKVDKLLYGKAWIWLIYCHLELWSSVMDLNLFLSVHLEN